MVQNDDNCVTTVSQQIETFVFECRSHPAVKWWATWLNLWYKTIWMSTPLWPRQSNCHFLPLWCVFLCLQGCTVQCFFCEPVVWSSCACTIVSAYIYNCFCLYYMRQCQYHCKQGSDGSEVMMLKQQCKLILLSFFCHYTGRILPRLPGSPTSWIP